MAASIPASISSSASPSIPASRNGLRLWAGRGAGRGARSCDDRHCQNYELSRKPMPLLLPCSCRPSGRSPPRFIRKAFTSAAPYVRTWILRASFAETPRPLRRPAMLAMRLASLPGSARSPQWRAQLACPGERQLASAYPTPAQKLRMQLELSTKAAARHRQCGLRLAGMR